MINLYYKSRCTSSTKAIRWFKKYGIDICIKSHGQISREEIISVLSSTEKGISDLLRSPNRVSDNEKSKIILIKNMKLNQAIDFIKENPSLLKTPIIIDKNKSLIGYHPDQIRMFLTKNYRRSFFNKSME